MIIAGVVSEIAARSTENIPAQTKSNGDLREAAY
jgi:hypothetical protein